MLQTASGDMIQASDLTYSFSIMIYHGDDLIDVKQIINASVYNTNILTEFRFGEQFNYIFNKQTPLKIKIQDATIYQGTAKKALSIFLLQGQKKTGLRFDSTRSQNNDNNYIIMELDSTDIIHIIFDKAFLLPL